MTWCQLKGLVTRIMNAKYQCSIFNTSEDMSQVKVFATDRQRNRWMDRRMSFNVLCFRERRGTKRGVLRMSGSFEQSIRNDFEFRITTTYIL